MSIVSENSWRSNASNRKEQTLSLLVHRNIGLGTRAHRKPPGSIELLKRRVMEDLRYRVEAVRVLSCSDTRRASNQQVMAQDVSRARAKHREAGPGQSPPQSGGCSIRGHDVHKDVHREMDLLRVVYSKQHKHEEHARVISMSEL